MKSKWKSQWKLWAVLALSLMLALNLVACAGGSDRREAAATTGAAASPNYGDSKYAPKEKTDSTGMAPDDGAGLSATAPADAARKIISDMNASLEVKEVPPVLDALKQSAEKAGGYVASSFMNESSGSYYAELVLKLPAATLESFAEQLSQYGKVRDNRTSTQDITDDYFDIQARLKNAEIQEGKLIDIMNKAETVEDILLVRQELDNVQERIERFKGKIQLWDKQVQYATFSLSIYTEARYISDDSTVRRPMSGSEFWENVKSGFSNSWIALVNFFAWLAIGLVRLALPLLILGVFALLIWLVVRRVLRKKTKQTPTVQNQVQQALYGQLPPYGPYAQAHPYTAQQQPSVQQTFAAPFEPEQPQAEAGQSTAAPDVKPSDAVEAAAEQAQSGERQ